MKHRFSWFRSVIVLLLIALLAGCSVTDASEAGPQKQDNADTSYESLSKTAFYPPAQSNPSPPRSVGAEPLDRTSVKVFWSPAEGADAYFVKRYNPSSGQWDIIAQTAGRSYTDSGLSPGGSYRYHVVAYNQTDGLVHFAPASDEAAVVTPQYTNAPLQVHAEAVSRTEVKISWSKAAGADAYFVKRYNPSTGQWDIFAQTSNLYATDSGLAPGESRLYHVVAYTIIDGQIHFAPVSPQSQAQTPVYVAAPAAVSAQAEGPQTAKVSWTAAAGADAYFLKRYNPASGQWDIIAQTTGLSFTDSNRTPGESYRYHVVAYTQFDGAIHFAPVSAEAAVSQPRYIYAPAQVTARAIGAYKVRLSWSASPDADGYAVKKYNAATGSWDILLQTSALSHTDTACSPQTQYRYHIVAYRTVNGQVWYAPVSPEADITTPALGEAPQNPNAFATASSVRLSWDAAAGAEGYAVKRYENGQWRVVGQISDTSFTDKNLTPNTSCSYIVVPYACAPDGTHYGASTESISAVTPVVSGPERLSAFTQGRNAIQLHWDMGDLAQGYVLRRSLSANGPFENIASTQQRSWLDTGLTAGVTYYYDVVAYRYIDGQIWYASPLCTASASTQTEQAEASESGRNADRTVGLDANGRAFQTINGYKSNRSVGVMYWPWFGTGAPFFDDIYDNSVILSKPGGYQKLFYQSTADSPAGGTHYWGEPLWGYYHSRDPYVIRRQLELLTTAGVDFLFFDTTNAWTYTEAVIDIMKVIDELQSEGWNPPRIVYYTHSHSLDTIRTIYNDVYKKNLYPGTWYRTGSKPVIIGYTTVAEDLAEAAVRKDTAYNPAPLSAEILDFFDFKMPQWPDAQYLGNGFPWIEFTYPQPAHGTVMNVSVASNPAPPFSFSVTRGLTNWGRGYNVSTGANSYADVFTGRFFQSSWDTVLNAAQPPQTVTVNGWNQWVAGKNHYDGEYSFCDVMNMEYSTDIEMMKGGYGDTYYQLLVKNIRAYKGNAASNPGYVRKTVDIYGSASQWDSVNAVYRRIGAQTYGRDYINAAGNARYVQPEPRNNLQEVRVTSDSSYIYFYIRCSKDIVSASDARWMNIFIGRGTPSQKGWNGYDYVVNRMRSGNTASVEALSSNYLGSVTASADINLCGSVLNVRIPRAALGMSGSDTFYFKVADDIGDPSQIMNYYTSGSSLPLGRLSFQYS